MDLALAANHTITGMETDMDIGMSMKGSEKCGTTPAAAATATATANAKIEMDSDAMLPVDVRDMRVRCVHVTCNAMVSPLSILTRNHHQGTVTCTIHMNHGVEVEVNIITSVF